MAKLVSVQCDQYRWFKAMILHYDIVRSRKIIVRTCQFYLCAQKPAGFSGLWVKSYSPVPGNSTQFSATSRHMASEALGG